MDRSMRFAGPYMFYPNDPTEIIQWKKQVLSNWKKPQPSYRNVYSAIIPHAGYIYSGSVAIKTLSCIPLPKTIVIIGVNHTGIGRPLSVWSKGRWETPFGWIPVDEALASKIIQTDPHFESDYKAHLEEHSIEVILSLLASFSTNFQVLPITMGYQDVYSVEELGTLLSSISTTHPVFVIASSDMSHYIPKDQAYQYDQNILQHWYSLHWKEAIETAEQNDYSVCGIGPGSVSCLYAQQKGASKGILVDYSHSGEVTKDNDAVVSYAGVLFVS
ncbi:MAG TPA: AmmeMemoRadiSam system protein B [Caldisericia bacterium]|nr:AmmeMemoRadiSam system protein B [Caldisericia bacterium]HXK51150.1 AmmeMemoRadiSam system protein B [Caldisericia bacterium]